MTTLTTSAERLVDIRAEYDDGNTYAIDVPFLLDLIAERDAEIAALKHAAGVHAEYCHD